MKSFEVIIAFSVKAKNYDSAQKKAYKVVVKKLRCFQNWIYIEETDDPTGTNIDEFWKQVKK